MNILVFESGLSGHRSEYISHLVKYLIASQTEHYYIFILHTDFEQKFPDIINPGKDHSNIIFNYLHAEETNSPTPKKSMIGRSIQEFSIMNRYALYHKVSHVILLHLNVFQFALGKFKTPYTLSGILFKPFALQSHKNAIKGFLVRLRKVWQTKWMLKHNTLKSILILNDVESAKFLNQYFKTSVFRYLPDPIPEFVADQSFDIRATYNIASSKTIYLHPGSLDDRKGTLEVIHSIRYLDAKVSASIAILIIGRSVPAFDIQIRDAITSLGENSTVQLIYENGFISSERLKSLLEQTDFVLIPYKSAEASSGILGHALINRKKVIGPNSGLMGNLILEGNLGYRLQEITGQEIASAITESSNSGDNILMENEFQRQYIESHTKEAFADLILNPEKW